MGHETSIKAFPLTILRFFVFSESESSIADHKTIIHMQYEAVSKKKKLRTCPYKWVQHCIVSKTAVAFRSLEVVSNGHMSFHFDRLILITVDCVFILDEQSLL